ncbi:uncharacterized protein LOC123262308 isoform X1 [Cotesia glomerata]|uniref:uncharacterized protein LOC123262308 isoform X1 n=1 Tax=Cotesia glomerata TaxID=32391 RepID=UPI001D02A024|nr:uncharacterized protein LOC123262308 isoform X1 [Cotesia glomerata]
MTRKLSLLIFLVGCLSVTSAQSLYLQEPNHHQRSHSNNINSNNNNRDPLVSSTPESPKEPEGVSVPASEDSTRAFTASVHGYQVNDVPTSSGAPIGPDGRVIDTQDVTVAKAKHAAAYINQKVNLAREAARSNAGGFAKSPEVLLEYQDSLGQYSFGYSAPGSARSEVGAADGSTRGAFSYVDGSGVVQTAKYTADGENGFRIEASNLPVAPRPVEETPEVQAARLEHIRAYEEAKKNLIAAGSLMPDQSTGENQDKIIEKENKKDEIKEEKKSEKEEKKESLMMAKLKENISEAKKEDPKIPVVSTSFVLPKSNLNIQNRIELRGSGSGNFYGSAPSADQGNAKGNEKLQLKTSDASHVQFYRTPLVRYSPIGYPVYYNHLQYVPSYYYF